MSDCNHGHSHVCKVNTSSSLYQTLDELEFERGIWSAAQSGDLDRIKKLLGDGEDPNRLDNAGYTAIHYAARNGHLDVCTYLLNSGACINATTRAGKATALHRASTAGKLAIVELLLSKKANVHLLDADGKTALHRAAESNRQDIYDLLKRDFPELETVRDAKSKLPTDYGPS